MAPKIAGLSLLKFRSEVRATRALHTSFFHMQLNALALHRSQLKPRRDSRINALLLSRVKPISFKVPLPKRKSDES